MELIIDISDDFYNVLIDSRYDKIRNIELEYLDLVQKIKNGTLLPKGHGDLIDRDQILQGEHFVILGDVSVGDKNFGEQEIDMFPKQTIMSVKPIIEAEKGK